MNLTETTAAQTEHVLSYYGVRGLYFLAVVFVATIVKVCVGVPIFSGSGVLNILNCLMF